MVYRRVGDTLLTEEEYEKHIDTWIAVIFVIAGTIAGSLGGYYLLEYFDLLKIAKWIRFSVIISSTILGGFLFFRLRVILLAMVYLFVIITLFVMILAFLWANI